MYRSGDDDYDERVDPTDPGYHSDDPAARDRVCGLCATDRIKRHYIIELGATEARTDDELLESEREHIKDRDEFQISPDDPNYEFDGTPQTATLNIVVCSDCYRDYKNRWLFHGNVEFVLG
jgi:hypothetical protein